VGLWFWRLTTDFITRLNEDLKMNNDFIVISYEYWLLLKDKNSIS